MRQLKLLALATVIGTSSLFASTIDRDVKNKEDKQSSAKTKLQSTVSKNEIIVSNEFTYTSKYKKNDYKNSIYKNVEINVDQKLSFIEFQNQAARDYSYAIRPEIISKE
tara:strand:- start:174 stop:500 length:327 start_codon:yes stop_codon:yes gene_type:complete